MMRIKNIIKKIKCHFYPPKPSLPFFTNEIFKDKKFVIGDYTYGNPTVLFENHEANLIIGKFCSIADGVTIFLGGNHRVDWISTYPFNVLNNHFTEAKNIKGHPASKGNVIIGNDVWIGRGAVIMSGITIGDGAIVAAGSVVIKNIGDYELWGGNPAKLLKKRFKDDDIAKLQEMKWWSWDITDIKKNMVVLCSSNLELLKNEKK